MLRAMRSPGDPISGLFVDGGVALGVVRGEWETDPSIAGVADVVVDGEIAVAADAALYYRADLAAAIAAASVPVPGREPAQLIAGAYRAWGERFVERLEGDFAFVLYDRSARKVLAARDFTGRRPLHFGRVADGIVLASTVGGVLAHPGVRGELNLVALAEDAAGLTGSATETSYREVSRVPAAHTLVWEAGSAPRLVRHWEPEPARGGEHLPFEDASRHLLALLREAVRERIPGGGPAAIFLSGGWDSPALFAAGRSLEDGVGGEARLLPVSMSYPTGDPGREDEIIDAILEHYDGSTRWIRSEQIPFWEDAERRAALRDEPFAHAFDDWNQALVDAARGEGTHVALDGYGGDQLFQVSNVFLADLARKGAGRELVREWRAKRLSLRDAGAWWQWVLLPLLPEPIRGGVRRAGNDGLFRSHLERALPGWVSRDFARRHSLVERERSHNPVRWQGERGIAEMRWYLTHPFFPRVLSYLGRMGEAAGLELRSPLYDRRIVEFALGRPRRERSSGGETKRLLRAAVDGLLPGWVLQPRKWRTGTTDAHLARSLTGAFAGVIERALRRPALVETGIADAAELGKRVERFVRDGDGEPALGLELFHAAQAELWLRSRLRGGQPAPEQAATAAV
jgi:asparagine synthase (glutamine-hydrolysing)